MDDNPTPGTQSAVPVPASRTVSSSVSAVWLICTQARSLPLWRAAFITASVGGIDAMPGLPPTTAYTYAAEFSLDEAGEAQASEVRCSKPVDAGRSPTGEELPVTGVDAMLSSPKTKAPTISARRCSPQRSIPSTPREPRLMTGPG
jgi:hypothetical protein